MNSVCTETVVLMLPFTTLRKKNHSFFSSLRQDLIAESTGLFITISFCPDSLFFFFHIFFPHKTNFNMKYFKIDCKLKSLLVYNAAVVYCKANHECMTQGNTSLFFSLYSHLPSILLSSFPSILSD